MDKALVIQKAIDNKETITISYMGGSHPGSVRELAPISIKNGKVRARCRSSNKVKVFIIEKIKLNPDPQVMHRWSPDVKYKSLSDLYEQISHDLQHHGWHVDYAIDDESGYIRLHRKFLDGAPLKGIEVEILFSKYAFRDIISHESYNFETFQYEQEQVLSDRPYSVYGKGNEYKHFKHLDKAAACFIELSKQLDPTSKRKSKK